jgi:hypothetical protein
MVVSDPPPPPQNPVSPQIVPFLGYSYVPRSSREACSAGLMVGSDEVPHFTSLHENDNFTLFIIVLQQDTAYSVASFIPIEDIHP